jgi:hypothetical protein
MRGRLTELAALDQYACDSLVERSPARRAESAVNRLLDERMADHVSDVEVVVSLDDQSRLDQVIQLLIRVIHGRCPKPVQLRDSHGPSDGGQHFERFPGSGVEALDTGGDPLSQSSRNLRQAGRRKVGALREQGLEEGNREQGVPLRLVEKPGHQS